MPCFVHDVDSALMVNSIISEMFSNSMADLESALPDTVQRLVTDLPQDFDSPDPFNRPLYIISMESFIQFVLVPHGATRIIGQDMDVQYMDAVDIKDDSAEYSDMFYWDKYTRGGLRNVFASSQEISPPCKKKNHLPESTHHRFLLHSLTRNI
ncbi:hypothetical protein B0H13DRAFT_2300339 [Mycena leptocephala]|nr:hypothetical protein B0H13DRAFT_2300339 [Mycena leptocephala]